MMIAPVWLNGEILPAGTCIDTADRGFTLGDGVFETIAIKAAMPCQLDLHLARLARGQALLGLGCKWNIEAAIGDLLARTAMRQGVLRITLTRGVAARGLWPGRMDQPTLLLTCAAPPPPAVPARAVLSVATRRNEMSPLSRIKSTNYLDNILARAEAAARGADDAVLCNTRGAIACASAANIVVERNGRWLTPRVADGALPGTVRHCLLAAGAIEEAEVWPETLRAAEAILLTNSLAITPVSEFEGRALEGSGDRLAGMRGLVEE